MSELRGLEQISKTFAEGRLEAAEEDSGLRTIDVLVYSREQEAEKVKVDGQIPGLSRALTSVECN